MNSIESKVSEWLNKSGYPLEMLVATKMQAAGFAVVQSEYYEDTESGKWRETDVIGYVHAHGKTCRTILALTVECKGGRDKPWVLFTSTDRYPDGLSVSRRASTEAGQSVLRTLALKEEVRSSPLFAVPARPGYGLTVALRDGDKQNPAYEALQAVCKAALGIVSRLGKVPLERIIPFAWPVIVTAAPLFECYLSSDGEMRLEQIQKGVLIWKNPLITRHTIVHIYTKDTFIAEASNIWAASVDFLRMAAAEHDRSPRLKANDNAT